MSSAKILSLAVALLIGASSLVMAQSAGRYDQRTGMSSSNPYSADYHGYDRPTDRDN